MKKTIRCMAYQSDGLYIAACLDLSLAAQADSLHDAVEKLNAQIGALLEEVEREPQYAAQLLNRPAPLSLWFKYYWLKFLAAKNGNKRGTVFFEESCPA